MTNAKKSATQVSISSAAIEKRSEISLTERQEEEVTGDLNIRILKAMIERITGKKVKVFRLERGTVPEGKTEPVSDQKTVENVEGTSGFGLVYDYHESHYEAEHTAFNSSGTIVTSDGVEIDFTAEMSMSREFYTEENVNIRLGEALKDPLVINFSGTAAELTADTFAFDIDANGSDENISFVTDRSGFLVLDKNQDGIVNDGQELFGALSGDGFADLAVHDSDDNGWIDENDPIYERLQVWVKDDNGKDSLFALGQKGVGAIYLGNVETKFSLKDSQNELLGQVNSTGIYIKDNYEIGTVQQLDLVV